MLLTELLAQTAQSSPQRPALFFRDTVVSYRELYGGVLKLANGLISLGLLPGDRIGLLLPNCPPFVMAYYAAATMGGVTVPSNPLLKPAELEYVWRDAAVKCVVTIPQLLPVVQAARVHLPALRGVVSIAPPDAAQTAQMGEVAGLTLLSELLAVPAPPQSEIMARETDCAVIIYTSGTTGRPKGAMLSHRNLTRNVEQVQTQFRIQPEDRFLTVIPLFHSFAATVCMNLPIGAGAASILLDSFVPARTLDTLETQNVTIFAAVPAIYNALLGLRPTPVPEENVGGPPAVSSLRMLISGGAPLPAATLTRLEQRFQTPVLEGDGPTECSPVTSVNPLEGPRKIGSVGPPLPGVEIAIWDEQNRPLPTGELGEIVVRGDNVMLGYLNQPDETALAFAGGWYHTGDLGTMDADGYVFILDRKKDMIITAGLNVYPREIEDVLLTHPGVLDVAVIGQPDALRGEEVVAVVVPNPEAQPMERELAVYCRERLANYKLPRRFLFRDSLPRGSTGKVVKRLLKKELELEASGQTFTET